jgi:hypothetical protein
MAVSNRVISLEIAQMMERHGADAIAAAMKTLKTTKASKKDMNIKALRTEFDKMMAQPQFAKMTLKLFKTEAVAAWNRAHPEGTVKKANAYTEFVKENMQMVRTKYPHITHEDHMKHIGMMWKKHKADLGVATEGTKDSKDFQTSSLSTNDTNDTKSKKSQDTATSNEKVKDMLTIGTQPHDVEHDLIADMLTTPNTDTKSKKRVRTPTPTPNPDMSQFEPRRTRSKNTNSQC